VVVVVVGRGHALVALDEHARRALALDFAHLRPVGDPRDGLRATMEREGEREIATKVKRLERQSKERDAPRPS
jgi:hypothetical protein